MIGGRIALNKQWLIVEDPDGIIKAYRSPWNYHNNTPSMSSFTWPDINAMITEANEHGDFTDELFVETVGETRFPPTVDICVGCGQEFPAEELLYEGMEPVVHSARCRICMIKQAQDIFGPENVILPESYRN